MRTLCFFILFAAIACNGRAETPTFADVPYGPHPRNVLDFWRAGGDGPRPLLIFIHGGSWTGGDKSWAAEQVGSFLKKGISCAAVNYRLSRETPLPAPVHDAARAVQFLRAKAQAWNIDGTRVGLTGGSAGACTAMWILLHDDLADPEAADPVLRESTRVTAAAVANGQTSIDPKVIGDWAGPNVLKHHMIWEAVGEKTMADALANYEKHKTLYVEFSPCNHLTADDPPLMMTYGHEMTLPSENANHGIHHPVFGVKLKEQSDRLGHECHLRFKGGPVTGAYRTREEFLVDKLLGNR